MSLGYAIFLTIMFLPMYLTGFSNGFDLVMYILFLTAFSCNRSSKPFYGAPKETINIFEMLTAAKGGTFIIHA